MVDGGSRKVTSSLPNELLQAMEGAVREGAAPSYSAFVAEAVKVPATRDTLRAVGQEPFSLTPPEYAAYLERARANWAPIVKASGFSLDE